MNRMLDKLLSLGLVDLSRVKGCSLQELEQIKIQQGIQQLPELYEDFLRVMGRGDGGLYSGSSCVYPELLSLKKDAEMLLAANDHPFKLPYDACVFWMHQGYQFVYFLTAEPNDDPPVYYYTEDTEIMPPDQAPRREWEHLSEFLTMFIEEEEGTESQKIFLSEWKHLE